jgi:hypothetical protein
MITENPRTSLRGSVANKFFTRKRFRFLLEDSRWIKIADNNTKQDSGKIEKQAQGEVQIKGWLSALEYSLLVKVFIASV